MGVVVSRSGGAGRDSAVVPREWLPPRRVDPGRGVPDGGLRPFRDPTGRAPRATSDRDEQE